MKTSKAYYFLQLSIGVLSLVTFFHFTFPYLMREDISIKETKKLDIPCPEPPIESLPPDYKEHNVTSPDQNKKLEEPIKRAPTYKKYYSTGPASRESVPYRRNVVVSPQKEPSSRPSTTVHKRVVTKIESPEETKVPEVPIKGNLWEWDPTNFESFETNPTKIETPKTLEGPISFWDNFCLDKIERFFKFTSSIIGTIFPLVGFAMSYILWKERRKEQKTQSV